MDLNSSFLSWGVRWHGRRVSVPVQRVPPDDHLQQRGLVCFLESTCLCVLPGNQCSQLRLLPFSLSLPPSCQQLRTDLKVWLNNVNIGVFKRTIQPTHFLSVNFITALFKDNFYKHIFYETCMYYEARWLFKNNNEFRNFCFCVKNVSFVFNKNPFLIISLS